jgi:hypothetical protein
LALSERACTSWILQGFKLTVWLMLHGVHSSELTLWTMNEHCCEVTDCLLPCGQPVLLPWQMQFISTELLYQYPCVWFVFDLGDQRLSCSHRFWFMIPKNTFKFLSPQYSLTHRAVKADSHIACRAHATPMPFPCHAMR